MHSHRLGRRHLTLIQAALSIITILAVLDFSGSFAAQGALLNSVARPTGDLTVRGNLDGLAGTEAAQRTLPAQGTYITSPTVAFDTLNSRAGGTLDVTWDAQTGIPRFLTTNSKLARIPYTPTVAEIGNAHAIALGFLDENRALFGLQSAATDFGPARMDADTQLGFSNLRLPQVYKGIPVYARQMVMHLDESNRIVAVNDQYVPGLNVATQASIAKDQAEQLALSNIKSIQLDPNESSRVKATILKDKTALTVYVDEAGKATLTWSVKVLTTSPLGDWTVFVNARRPVVVHATDGADHAKSRETYSAGNGTDIPGNILAQEGERTRDKIGQAAHDAAGKVYDYYFSTFKRDSIDGHGMTMVSTVHYGTDPQDAENAAWIGEAQQMIYGDGGTLFKPLAYGLDVVGHEFTHGITDNTAQLVYESQPGALNESYSDVFGAMIDRANWNIGEAVIKSPPYPAPYLRSLQDPGLGGNYDRSNPLKSAGQPSKMSEYANLPVSRRADNGGVHVNSGIPNHVAYLIGTAIGKEKLEQIYYRTLIQYLSPQSNFADAGRATVQAATDLYGATEADAVRTAFGQVGINIGGSQSGPTPPAAPSSTPVPGTQAPPAQPLPQGCRDLITNGGFESTGGWHEVSTNHTQIIDTELPHTGSQSAWLGGTDEESVQYIYQDVAVPSNATSAQLSYYRLIHEEFSGLSGLIAKDATFTVLLADNQGNEIAKIETLSSAKGNDKWQQVQFDLARYAGQNIRLVFAASNSRGNISSLFVDDVAFAACTTGQAPQAPSTSNSGQVYIDGNITNADTGRGIAGAEIFILKPGITASAAASDQEITDDEVLAQGTTDNKGYYQTKTPVARGQKYSVVIIANGYRSVLADNGMNVPSTATNPTHINATMRAGR